MRIPVFVSCPSTLSPAQEASRKIIVERLAEVHLEPRTLGRTDYPDEYPLREVLVIARHCSGGVVLGFEQCLATHGAWKRDTNEARRFGPKSAVPFPTPWNHLEAGLLFALQLPLLIFKEPEITGGVFDPGVTDVFIHKMPVSGMAARDLKALKSVILKWHGKVTQHYYSG